MFRRSWMRSSLGAALVDSLPQGFCRRLGRKFLCWSSMTRQEDVATHSSKRDSNSTSASIEKFGQDLLQECITLVAFIGVNPGGWGSRPPDFGQGGRGVLQGGRGVVDGS